MNFIRERRQSKTIVSHRLGFRAQRPWGQVSFAAGQAHALKRGGNQSAFQVFEDDGGVCGRKFPTGIELKKSLENRNNQEETEEKTDDTSFPSEDEIFNQIKESFSESIAK